MHEVGSSATTENRFISCGGRKIYGKHDTNIKGKGIFTFHACDRLRLCRAGCINYSFLGRRRLELKLRRYHACIGSHNCNHVRRRRLKPQRPISVSVYHSKHRLIRNQHASPIGGTSTSFQKYHCTDCTPN